MQYLPKQEGHHTHMHTIYFR